MLKKLLIPFFVISVAAVASNGCGSSSSTTGTAGKGGTAGAGGGTAGAGTAGAGTAGAGTAGSGTAGSGTAGTDGGSAGAGTAGSDAGTDAGTAGATTTDSGADSSSDATDGGGAPNVASLEAIDCPAKRTAQNAATPFSAADFCALYENVCGAQTFADALTSDDCVATYTAWATKTVNNQPTVGVQNCTSYHLCNAVTAGAATHCPHAAATVASATCNPAN